MTHQVPRKVKLAFCKRGHPASMRAPSGACRGCQRIMKAARLARRKRPTVDGRFDPAVLSTLRGIATVPVKLFPEVNEFFGWFGASASPGDCVAAIVGEKLRDDQPPSTPPLFWGRTGGFLINSLRAIGRDYQTMYFTNALKPTEGNGSHRHNKDLLRDELLGLVVPDRIIALGEVASTRLQAAGVPHVSVPHPSWFLRFHYAARAEYKTLLRGAFRLQREPDEVESQA